MASLVRILVWKYPGLAHKDCHDTDDWEASQTNLALCFCWLFCLTVPSVLRFAPRKKVSKRDPDEAQSFGRSSRVFFRTRSLLISPWLVTVMFLPKKKTVQEKKWKLSLYLCSMKGMSAPTFPPTPLSCSASTHRWKVREKKSFPLIDQAILQPPYHRQL